MYVLTNYYQPKPAAAFAYVHAKADVSHPTVCDPAATFEAVDPKPVTVTLSALLLNISSRLSPSGTSICQVPKVNKPSL